MHWLTTVVRRAATIALASALFGQGAFAVTLRVADQGDAVSMDPHSFNESLQLSFTGNVYEPLVARDKSLGLVPGLATSWKQTDPTTWRFELRRGVRFHDGSPFSADDVIFSYRRALAEGSDVKTYVGTIREIRRVGEHSIDIVTAAPFPILPDVLTLWYIMSKAWCETNGATQPVDKRKGVENAASFRANGTGPFRLKSRDPGVRTVLARHAGYWDRIETNIEEVIFTPIGNDATRVAALISGEVDLMQPVPVQDAARLSQNPALKVMLGPELRTIFLGMDQKRDELLYSSVKGKNPFKDRRVRQAFYNAIDIDAIRSRIMRGAAVPAALLIGPGVKGFAPEQNRRLPHDPEAARKLLAEAGYPNGFEVKLNCPNDRYINDSEICQAVAGMLARIGVRVQLETESKATYFPKVLSRNTSFYMLGWTPGTYDAHNVLFSVMASPGAAGQGQFNLGSYSNTRLDDLTARIASETNPGRRDAMIAEALKIHAEDVGHLPLHQQSLAWGMKKNVNPAQRPDNFTPYKYVVVR
ncbi:MAG TPA: ABC transporter substrate-binding protein [Burkholderiaceae bacterium]|jgi:peptide/nickel transport system substrate-binding protein|nr:ABC transporter substrate-binding protein [Burkholderiaceae bacterium]